MDTWREPRWTCTPQSRKRTPKSGSRCCRDVRTPLSPLVSLYYCLAVFHTYLLPLLPRFSLTTRVDIGGSTEEAQEAIGLEVSQVLISLINKGATVGAVNFPEVSLSLSLFLFPLFLSPSPSQSPSASLPSHSFCFFFRSFPSSPYLYISSLFVFCFFFFLR